jgi:hypothetical protein
MGQFNQYSGGVGAERRAEKKYLLDRIPVWLGSIVSLCYA